MGSASAEEKSLESYAATCDARVRSIKTQLDDTDAKANMFMISGAVLAAVGSALAGFLQGTSIRRVSAVVGALGGVVSVLPKTLPDRAEVQSLLLRADRHRTTGEKVRGQITFLNDENYAQVCRQYVIARYVDCAGLAAPEGVPDIPVAMPTKVAAAAGVAEPPEEAYQPVIVQMGAPEPPRPRLKPHAPPTPVVRPVEPDEF